MSEICNSHSGQVVSIVKYLLLGSEFYSSLNGVTSIVNSSLPRK
nr:MAG TPA: hypothetical protein [Caudoviricetes sp.]DAT69824.1 MAG TPA: hypothetical protein [Caudoviricetes sp.]